MNIRSLSWQTLENGLTVGYDQQATMSFGCRSEKPSRPLIPTGRELDLLTATFGELDWHYEVSDLNNSENLGKVVLSQEGYTSCLSYWKGERNVPHGYSCYLIYPPHPSIDPHWGLVTDTKGFTHAERYQRAGIMAHLRLEALEGRTLSFLSNDLIQDLFEGEKRVRFYPRPITVPSSLENKILPYAFLSKEQAQNAVDMVEEDWKLAFFREIMNDIQQEFPYNTLKRVEKGRLKHMIHQAFSREGLRQRIDEAKRNRNLVELSGEKVDYMGADDWKERVEELRTLLRWY